MRGVVLLFQSSRASAGLVAALGVSVVPALTACGARVQDEPLGRASGSPAQGGADLRRPEDPTGPNPPAASTCCAAQLAPAESGPLANDVGHNSANLGAIVLTSGSTSIGADQVTAGQQESAASAEDEVVGFSVTSADFEPHTTECRVWLDEPSSALEQTDIIVRAKGTTWSADASCTIDPAWYLSLDTLGMWLALCPVSCGSMRADPTLTLEVEATFRAGPRYQVK
jgi:hypothetical protein